MLGISWGLKVFLSSGCSIVHSWEGKRWNVRVAVSYRQSSSHQKGKGPALGRTRRALGVLKRFDFYRVTTVGAFCSLISNNAISEKPIINYVGREALTRILFASLVQFCLDAGADGRPTTCRIQLGELQGGSAYSERHLMIQVRGVFPCSLSRSRNHGR